MKNHNKGLKAYWRIGENGTLIIIHHIYRQMLLTIELPKHIQFKMPIQPVLLFHSDIMIFWFRAGSDYFFVKTGSAAVLSYFFIDFFVDIFRFKLAPFQLCSSFWEVV